ncbi:RNA-binding protein [Haloimpatiens sp. FM7315]|uniref:RNA-binding protein n=1 Tax=Haloimpatiens sp. FM7315 TaxID=3298609 RepID=UPI00370CC30E
MDKKNLIGRMVISKAGRDKDKRFIIVDVIDDKYVSICDGNLRKAENPKKKKLMHLRLTNNIAEKLTGETKVSDFEITELLKSMEVNEEV